MAVLSLTAISSRQPLDGLNKLYLWGGCQWCTKNIQQTQHIFDINTIHKTYITIYNTITTIFFFFLSGGQSLRFRRCSRTNTSNSCADTNARHGCSTITGRDTEVDACHAQPTDRHERSLEYQVSICRKISYCLN